MISALFLLFCIIKMEDYVKRYIVAVNIWMLYCFTFTELLSVFSAVETINLWICWGMLDVVLLKINLSKLRRKTGHQICSLAGRYLVFKEIILGMFIAGMIYLALKTMPYNYDSMTYHMARIFHWFQNGTVEHYATHIDRQVASPVLGEFVNLHIYALMGGNDFAVNLLQCMSFVTDGVLVYHIARKINCSKQYCVLAVILFYSMPVAFAEALTTQMDNFAALWMLCFVYLMLDLLNPEEKIVLGKKGAINVIMLALCVAFGYLSKPSIGIAMVVFALWLLLVIVERKDDVITIGLYFFLAGSVLAVVLLPECLRNLVTFHALSAPVAGERQLIGTLKPGYVLVNFIKNFTFNMPTVWLYNSSGLILKCVMKLSSLMKVDINDPTISEDGRIFQVHDAQTYWHDTAVNPVIIWLIIICILLFFIKNRKQTARCIENRYFMTAVISFLAFCVVLRWEPYVSRYMISYFALLCPAVSRQLQIFFNDRNEKEKKVECGFIAIVGFLCGVEIAGMMNYHYEIASRQSGWEGYFVSRSEGVAESYKEIADFITDGSYKTVGLLIGKDSYEYPLDVMLDDVRIEHINVTNETEKYEDTEFTPDIIVSIEYDEHQDRIICNGCEYENARVINEEIYLLKKTE